jgi:hypothetical protein
MPYMESCCFSKSNHDKTCHRSCGNDVAVSSRLYRQSLFERKSIRWSRSINYYIIYYDDITIAIIAKKRMGKVRALQFRRFHRGVTGKWQQIWLKSKSSRRTNLSRTLGSLDKVRNEYMELVIVSIVSHAIRKTLDVSFIVSRIGIPWYILDKSACRIIFEYIFKIAIIIRKMYILWI